MWALTCIKVVRAVGKKIPLWLWVAVGVLIAYWGVYHRAHSNGVAETEAKWQAERAALQAAVKDAKEKNTTINMIVDTVVKTEVVRIRENAKEIIREVPVYIPADTPDLPAGFRLLHDAAAEGRQTNSADVATATPVPVDHAATVIISNYASCLAWREQVLGWQSWYQQLHE